jgi:hypothetical protein
LDNSTVVRYINKQGGTHSPQLCMRTWKLWFSLPCVLLSATSDCLMPIAIVSKFSCTTEESVCPLVCLCILLQLNCPENLNKGRSITQWNTEHIDNSDNRCFQKRVPGSPKQKETFQGIWSKKESLLNWIGRMNNLAFGISSMQEAIVTNRWRKSLAVAWLSIF